MHKCTYKHTHMYKQTNAHIAYQSEELYGQVVQVGDGLYPVVCQAEVGESAEAGQAADLGDLVAWGRKSRRGRQHAICLRACAHACTMCVCSFTCRTSQIRGIGKMECH